MARIAKKKKVDNNAGLLNVIDGIKRTDVTEVADFGPFFIVLLKDGAIYHTHFGYEVRCKRWLMDLSGGTNETTLYNWLCNLVQMKKATAGHEDEMFPETDQTKEQMLEYSKLITDANMLHPVTAFSDLETATKFANERINYLRESSQKLDSAMNSNVKEESEEDLKKNFEQGQQEIIADQLRQELKNEEDALE